jgi:hypothetical protein
MVSGGRFCFVLLGPSENILKTDTSPILTSFLLSAYSELLKRPSLVVIGKQVSIDIKWM